MSLQQVTPVRLTTTLTVIYHTPLATNAVRMGALVGKNIAATKFVTVGLNQLRSPPLRLEHWLNWGEWLPCCPRFRHSFSIRGGQLPSRIPPTNEKIYMKLVYEVGTNRIVVGK